MTNRLQLFEGRLFENRNEWAVFAGLACITLVGFYLRYRCLGCLGFRWDEDITSLAVKALLEKGVPEFPSGMIYLRFFPLQLVMSGSVEWLGFSEFSMRLPSVFFGTLLIPVTYWITTRFFGRNVALIVAACVAFSFWQVEMARTARMYAPFFVTYLLAAYAIYRYHFQDTNKVFSFWVLPLSLLALTMHQLAYSLALLLLLAIPLSRSLLRALSLGAQAAVVGLAFVFVNIVQQRYFNIPRALSESVGSQTPGNQVSGALEALLHQVSLPDLSFLVQVASAFPVPAVTAVVATLIVATRLLRRALHVGRIYALLTGLSVLFALAHQFNLVVIALTLMLVLLRSGIGGVRLPEWYWPALVCGSLLVLWLLTVAFLTLSIPSDVEIVSQGPRKMVRALVDYPNFRLFWSYLLERPLLALPLTLGTFWAIDRIARERPDPAALFLVGSFWLVLCVNGILTTKFEFFRYNLHLDPIYFMLVVAGIVALPSILDGLGMSHEGLFGAAAWKSTGPYVAAAVAIAGANPLGAVLTSQRDYSESGSLYSIAGLDNYADFKTPSEYVRERMNDEDRILVLDPREYWNYIGRVSHWIRTSNYESQTYDDSGRAKDLYLGVPLIHNLEELRGIIDAGAGSNLWILYSRTHLSTTPWVSSDIKSYLRGLEGNIVYVGKDSDTIVIRLSEPPDAGRNTTSGQLPNRPGLTTQLKM